MVNKKFYLAASLIGLIIVSYITYLFRYSLPAYDDYGYIISRLSGLTPYDISVNIYKTWNGRLVANFLYALFLPDFNLNMYHWVAKCAFMSFILATYLVIPDKILSKTEKIIVWSIFMTIILCSMNGMSTTFFWMGSITNYFIPLILFLFAIKPLLYGSGSIRQAISIIILCVASLCSEALSLMLLCFYIFLVTCFFYNKNYKSARLGILHMLIIIVAILVMYLSPGNEVRSMDKEKLNIVSVLLKSLLLSLERSAEWLFASPQIPGLLMISILLSKKTFPTILNNKTYKFTGIVFIIISIIFAWVPHFAMAYAMGYPSLPNRAKFIAQFFFQASSTIGALYVLKHYNIDLKLSSKTYKIKIIFTCFLMSITLSKEIFPSLLYIGKFEGYYAEQLKRYNIIESSENNKVILQAYPYKPPIVIGMHPFAKTSLDGIEHLFSKTSITIDGEDGYQNYKTIWSVARGTWEKTKPND